MELPMNSNRTSDLVVLSHPVEGLRGYVAWLVVGRDLERVKSQITKLTKGLEDRASFVYPRKMQVGAYFGWWCSEGYTIDEATRNGG